MADVIDLRASMRRLAPEALALKLKKIDSETQNGHISKEGLWNFLSTGKAGDLFESDFLELCTFMGKCSDEYRSARAANRGSVVDRVSRRFSVVADVTARRLSVISPGTDDAAKEVAAFEEGDADDEE
jgi:hypothetical protein